jgi:hypothetical protein
MNAFASILVTLVNYVRGAEQVTMEKFWELMEQLAHEMRAPHIHTFGASAGQAVTMTDAEAVDKVEAFAKQLTAKGAGPNVAAAGFDFGTWMAIAQLVQQVLAMLVKKQQTP